MAQRDPKAGFTLIELVVVLAIAAILLGLMTLGLNGLLAREQLESQVYQMHSDLRWAQDMAQKHKSTITFSCYRDDQGRCLYLITQGAGNPLLKQVILPKAVQVDFNMNTEVIFKTDGAIEKNGHLGLSSGKEKRYIYFYLTGRMRISAKII